MNDPFIKVAGKENGHKIFRRCQWVLIRTYQSAMKSSHSLEEYSEKKIELILIELSACYFRPVIDGSKY